MLHDLLNVTSCNRSCNIMTYLNSLPSKYQRKYIRRSFVQLCSMRWEAFARGFRGDICDMRFIRSGSLISVFFSVPNPGKTEPALTEDWPCSEIRWPHSLLVTVSEFALRVEIQRRPLLQWLGDKEPPPPPPTACITQIPVSCMVLCVFLPRLHLPSDTLFARWTHLLTPEIPADNLAGQRFNC